MISRPSYKGTKTIYPDFSKRYWYADIAHYYPGGFLADIEATCDTLKELKSLKKKESECEWQVLWDNRKFKEIEMEEVEK